MEPETIGKVIEISAYVISAAAIITAWTPNQWDNVLVAALRKALDVVGQNYRHAKNKD